MIILLIVSSLLIIFGVMLTLANLIKLGAIVMSIGALIAITIKIVNGLDNKQKKTALNKNIKVGDLVRIKINRNWQEGRIIRVTHNSRDMDLVDIRLNNTQVLRGISTKHIEKVTL